MRRQRPARSMSSLTHMASMIVMLGVLALAMQRVKDPGLWTWIASESGSTIRAQGGGAEGAPETRRFRVPEEEQETVEQEFALVTDRTPMKAADMPAYWRLMQWVQRQPFTELQQMARHDMLFTHFWETPGDWRGELVELRLHVRRVLEYSVPENPAQLKKVYEAWGWTDESGAFPYVIVFPELPAGMQLGDDIREEITFVGFFLKVMSYQAGDHPRGAPLLIGTIRRDTRLLPEAPPRPGVSWLIKLVGGAFVLSILAAGFRMFRIKPAVRQRRVEESTISPEETHAWLEELPRSSPRDETSTGGPPPSGV